MKIVALLQWVHSDCGGREKTPPVGAHVGFRLQKYFLDCLKIYRDVQIIKLEMDEVRGVTKAELRFLSSILDPKERLKKGQLIELLDVYTVIAVGKIIEYYE